jgi:hypothetical protein
MNFEWPLGICGTNEGGTSRLFVIAYDWQMLLRLSDRVNHEIQEMKRRNPGQKMYWLPSAPWQNDMRPLRVPGAEGYNPTNLRVGFSYSCTMRFGRAKNELFFSIARDGRYLDYDPAEDEQATYWLEPIVRDLSNQPDEIRVMHDKWLECLRCDTIGFQFEVDIEVHKLYPRGAPIHFNRKLALFVCSMVRGRAYCPLCGTAVWDGWGHTIHCPNHLAVVLLEFAVPGARKKLYLLSQFESTKWESDINWDTTSTNVMTQVWTFLMTRSQGFKAFNSTMMGRAVFYWCQRVTFALIMYPKDEWRTMVEEARDWAEVHRQTEELHAGRLSSGRERIAYVPFWFDREHVKMPKDEIVNRPPHSCTYIEQPPPEDLATRQMMRALMVTANMVWMGDHTIWIDRDGYYRAMYDGHEYRIGDVVKSTGAQGNYRPIPSSTQHVPAPSMQQRDNTRALIRDRMSIFCELDHEFVLDEDLERLEHKHWKEYLSMLDELCELEIGATDTMSAVAGMIYVGCGDRERAWKVYCKHRDSVARKLRTKMIDKWFVGLSALRGAVNDAFASDEGARRFASSRWAPYVLQDTNAHFPRLEGLQKETCALTAIKMREDRKRGATISSGGANYNILTQEMQSDAPTQQTGVTREDLRKTLENISNEGALEKSRQAAAKINDAILMRRGFRIVRDAPEVKSKRGQTEWQRDDKALQTSPSLEASMTSVATATEPPDAKRQKDAQDTDMDTSSIAGDKNNVEQFMQVINSMTEERRELLERLNTLNQRLFERDTRRKRRSKRKHRRRRRSPSTSSSTSSSSSDSSSSDSSSSEKELERKGHKDKKDKDSNGKQVAQSKAKDPPAQPSTSGTQTQTSASTSQLNPNAPVFTPMALRTAQYPPYNPNSIARGTQQPAHLLTQDLRYRLTRHGDSNAHYMTREEWLHVQHQEQWPQDPPPPPPPQ